MPKIVRYGHARQFQRMRKLIKQVKGFVGRVVRDLEWQVNVLWIRLSEVEHLHVLQANRLLEQTRKSKNKIYCLH